MYSPKARNALTNYHLPYFSPVSPKQCGNVSSRTPIKINNIQKQNTQSTIQFNQFTPNEHQRTLSPTFNRVISRGSVQLYKSPMSLSAIKKENYMQKNNENENNNIISSPIGVSKMMSFNLKTTCNIPSIYKKKIPKQNTKAAVPIQLLPKNGRNIISIKLESNWGDKPDILLYFISLVDKSNHQIKPFVLPNLFNENDVYSNSIYISSNPEPSSLDNLENLLDSSYIKDEKSIFRENFDDQKFTIFLSVHESFEIGGIRIFNPSTKSQSALKNVSIYVNGVFHCCDEVPQNFGVDLKLDIAPKIPNFFFTQENSLEHQASAVDNSMIPRVVFHCDKYGILPSIPIKQLKIEIIETYNGKINLGSDEIAKPYENLIGLNGCDIYDLFGKPIPTNKTIIEANQSEDNVHIKEVKMVGISKLINCGVILKQNKITNNPENMLLCEIDRSQYPSFIFTFSKPACVSKIKIWNYNGNNDKLVCGIRKLKIYTDNHLFWFGKIPIGDGSINDMEKYTYSIQMFDQIPNVELIEH